MHFVHYKDFQPVNLDKVGTIGKENQQVAKDAIIYAIGFYEFERKVAYWVFQSETERDEVFSNVRAHCSRDLHAKKTDISKQPAVARI